MLYDLSNSEDKSRLTAMVLELVARGSDVVEVKVKKPQRTVSQNSYLHVLCSYFAVEYGCSADYAKRHFYKETCNADMYVVVRKSKRGMPFTELRSSSALTTEEMSLSIDRFKNYSAQHGIRLPDAEDYRAMVWAQQEIERNREFL